MAGRNEKDTKPVGYKDGWYVSPRQVAALVVAISTISAGTPLFLNWASPSFRADPATGTALGDEIARIERIMDTKEKRLSDRLDRVESRNNGVHSDLTRRIERLEGKVNGDR